jgi:hypothetical protein
MKVYFSHGKESGPWGSKIQRLASIASEHGYTLHLIDGDHRLKGAIEMVEDLFGRFLCKLHRLEQRSTDQSLRFS